MEHGFYPLIVRRRIEPSETPSERTLVRIFRLSLL